MKTSSSSERRGSGNSPLVGSAVVPAFLTNTYALVNDAASDDAVSWNACGTAFTVHSKAALERELSKYFKHSRMASWRRQCNMYGIEKSGTVGEWVFSHPHFVRGHPERLALIERKASSGVSSSAGGPSTRDLRTQIYHLSAERNELAEQVERLEAHSASTGAVLHELQTENARLWELMQAHEQSQAAMQQALHSIMSCLAQHGARLDGDSAEEAAALIDAAAAMDVAPVADVTHAKAVRRRPALNRAFVPAPISVGGSGAMSLSAPVGSTVVFSPTPTREGAFVFEPEAWYNTTATKKRKTVNETTVATSFVDETMAFSDSPRRRRPALAAAPQTDNDTDAAALPAFDFSAPVFADDDNAAAATLLGEPELLHFLPYAGTPQTTPQTSPLAAALDLSSGGVGVTAFPPLSSFPRASDDELTESPAPDADLASGAHNRGRDRARPPVTGQGCEGRPRTSGNDERGRAAAMARAEELARRREAARECAVALLAGVASGAAAAQPLDDDSAPPSPPPAHRPSAARATAAVDAPAPVIYTPQTIAAVACHVLSVLTTLAARRQAVLAAAADAAAPSGASSWSSSAACSAACTAPHSAAHTVPSSPRPFFLGNPIVITAC